MRSQLMAGTCKVCSETNFRTGWRCRRCGNNIPMGLQGKYKHAMHAKNREWYSASSSSSGREEWKSQEQEEIKRLRAQVELLSKHEGMEKSPEEEVAWKKAVRWSRKRRQIVRKSWRTKRRACSGSCGILRSLRAWIWFSGTDRRRFGKKSWKKLRGKDQSFCRSIRKCRRGHKSRRACGIGRGITSRALVNVKK